MTKAKAKHRATVNIIAFAVLLAFAIVVRFMF